jgi:hypothetical protein
VNPQLTLALIAYFTELASGDAEKIAKELDLAVQPSTYRDAKALVERVVGEVKRKK